MLDFLAVNAVRPGLRCPVPHRSRAGDDNDIERWVGLDAAASPQKEVTRPGIANALRCPEGLPGSIHRCAPPRFAIAGYRFAVAGCFCLR